MSGRAILLCAVLVSGRVHAQTPAAVWRYAHPDAKAVVGIDWKRVMQSPIAAMLERNVGSLPVPVPGPDFLKQVEHVLVTSPGSATNSGQEEAPILIVIQGHFSSAEIRKALAAHGAKRQMYNSTPIYRPQGKPNQDLGFVLPDTETILIGDLGSLCAAIDRTEFNAATAGAPLLRAMELDTTYDAWAVVSTPASVASSTLLSLFSGENVSDSVRGFEAVMSLRDGLALTITLNAASEPGAKALASGISKTLRLAAKDQAANPALAEIAKKMRVSAASKGAIMTVRLTNSELDATGRKLEASLRKQRDVVQEAAVPEAVPAVVHKKMVIRIEGLDEGPREIPVEDR